MRLLVDQMFDAALAEALSEHGHDALRVAEVGLARADDAEILDRAIRDGRILVTLDGHFGDWCVLPLNRHPGVIRLKTHPTTTQNVLAALHPLLGAQTEPDFANHLVIASGKRARWVRTG